MELYLLFETVSGFSLFHAHGINKIGEDVEAVRNSIHDLERFRNVVKMVGFQPFPSAYPALVQCKKMSKGMLTEELKTFLVLNLPTVKEGKKPMFNVGVAEPKIGSQISETTKIPCLSNDLVLELFRGVWLHFNKFIVDLKQGDLERALLGLRLSYGHVNVEFDVNKVETMVIQAISSLDALDEDIAYSAMRVRKWYSCCFPEPVEVVNDNYLNAKVEIFVENKEQLSNDEIPGLVDILGDEDKAKEIGEAAKAPIGEDLSPMNLIIVQKFMQRVLDLSEYRKKLYEYLVIKMNYIAPNLASQVGVVVGARLISHVGGLANLAKCRPKQLQILGAEKELSRASKTREKTPKRGLIFHSSFVAQASAQNKDRVACCLACKCSLACRVDCFSEMKTNAFGEKLGRQVQQRLDFYEKRLASRKIDVMVTAIDSTMEKIERCGIK